jgi:hypothetical protein
MNYPESDNVEDQPDNPQAWFRDEPPASRRTPEQQRNYDSQPDNPQAYFRD